MKLQKAVSSLLAASMVVFTVGCTNDSVPPVEAAGPSGVKNVLLVHGAWSDGSSWAKVIPLLQADGYNVVAVQLPLTSLADDAAALQRALALQTGPVLLVGHSYGGSVITEAGNDPKVEGLVYVDAFAPDVSESALSLGKTAAPTPIGKDLVPDATGFLKLTPAGVATDFAQDLTATEQATIATTQGPVNAPNALGGTISVAAWKTRPSWYILATNDRVIGPELEQSMASRMKATTTTIASSHVVMLSQPTVVTSVIEKAATTLAP